MADAGLENFAGGPKPLTPVEGVALRIVGFDIQPDRPGLRVTGYSGVEESLADAAPLAGRAAT